MNRQLNDTQLSDFDFRAKQDKLAAHFKSQDTIDDSPPCLYVKHPLYKAADQRILDARAEHYRWGVRMRLFISFRNVVRGTTDVPAGAEADSAELARAVTKSIDFAAGNRAWWEDEEKRLYVLREELKQQIENGEHYVQH